MDLVNTQTTYKMSMNQKEKLNCVRMFLGVQYVSQISTVDGMNFVPGILDGDISHLCYQTTLTKPTQEKPGKHSWKVWKRTLKLLTVSPRKTTNKLTERLGQWIDDHSECGTWLSYHDRNGKFYARQDHTDKEWMIYKRTNKGTQLTCIDTVQKYKPTKYSTPVRIHTSAGGKVYSELGAELKITEALIVGPIESFQQLLTEQPKWIRDLVQFVQFSPDKQ